jgi:116 kDa U5 small nuclear ribonucleoprotein component
MIECKFSKGSAANKLIIHVTKLYSFRAGNSYDAFGRIYTGTCQAGQRVHVLGEGYVPEEDDEDMAVATVEAVVIPRGPSKIEVSLATSGNYVLLSGVDAIIAKTATIVGATTDGNDTVDPADDEGKSAMLYTS